MQQKPSQQSKICPKCRRLKLATDRRGSLTSFLFNDLSCNCNTPSKTPDDALKPAGQASRCARCKKIIPSVARLGSITAFFFKDQRCQCTKPLIIKNAALTSGLLNTRFQNKNSERKSRSKTKRKSVHPLSKEEIVAISQLSPGDTIGGCYEILELAGEGGMGAVYRAKHKVLERQCAIKFLAPSLVSEKSWLLFQKEAKINSTLLHHSICQVYDLGIHAGKLPYYAMDFVDGYSLEEVISFQGPLTLGATLEIFIKVCEGLSYAHRKGIIHKDIKPANIMVTTDNTEDLDVRVLDFGISELSEPSTASRSQNNLDDSDDEILGSAAYMSPEQFRGEELDKRSDIYNLGCSIFETLTGQTPFLADSFQELEEKHCETIPPTLREITGINFPHTLEAVIQKCLHKSPDFRYQNANELAIDLSRVLNGDPTQYAKPTFTPASPGSSKQSSIASILGLTAFILITTTALYAATFLNQVTNKTLENPERTPKTKEKIPAASNSRLHTVSVPNILLEEEFKSLPLTPYDTKQYQTGGVHYCKVFFPSETVGSILTDNQQWHTCSYSVTLRYSESLIYSPNSESGGGLLQQMQRIKPLKLTGLVISKAQLLSNQKDETGKSYFERAMKCAGQTFPLLSFLSLETAGESDAANIALASLPNLKELQLSANSVSAKIPGELTREPSNKIRLPSSLTQLAYTSSQFRPEQILELNGASSKLRDLALSCNCLKENSLNLTLGETPIEELTLQNCQTPVNTFLDIGKMKQLKKLNIIGLEYSPNRLINFEELAKLKELKSLFVETKPYNRGTIEALEELSKVRPDLKITNTKRLDEPKEIAPESEQ